MATAREYRIGEPRRGAAVWLIAVWLIVVLAAFLPTRPATGQEAVRGGTGGFSPRYTAPGFNGLDVWRAQRAARFWKRTSPFFGDPYYDPLKTSPRSPFRSPQYHPWRTSPFRGDPLYDPYARRRDRTIDQRPRGTSYRGRIR